MSISSFARACCECLDLKWDEITSTNRRADLVAARFAISYTLIRREKKTYKVVGQLFNRDHSSVVHGVRSWTNLLTVHDDHAWRVQQIVNMVYHNHLIFRHGEQETA